MLYTYSIGLRIQTKATYSAISDAGREQAREALFAELDAVASALSAPIDTNDPQLALSDALATVGGGVWTIAEPNVLEDYYYIHPGTGERICVRTYPVKLNGTEFSASASADSQTVSATFLIQQTAVN